MNRAAGILLLLMGGLGRAQEPSSSTPTITTPAPPKPSRWEWRGSSLLYHDASGELVAEPGLGPHRLEPGELPGGEAVGHPGEEVHVPGPGLSRGEARARPPRRTGGQDQERGHGSPAHRPHCKEREAG